MEKVFIPQRADPCVLRWDGWYYFTASVPAFDCIELRRARTLAELPEATKTSPAIRCPSF